MTWHPNKVHAPSARMERHTRHTLTFAPQPPQPPHSCLSSRVPFLLCHLSMEASGQPSRAAQRRRQRRLRSWLKHERQSIAMALAEYTHHASRGQTRARAREGVGLEKYVGLRAQKRPPPGERRAAGGSHGRLRGSLAHCGAGVGRQDRLCTLQFLLQQSLLARAEEEEKAREEAEVKVLEDDLVLQEQRLLRMVDEFRGAGPRPRLKAMILKRKEKKKKKRRKRTSMAHFRSCSS